MKILDLEFVKYKRVDFCFDIFMNMDYFYKNILLEKFKKDIQTFHQSKKKGMETIYF